MSNPRQPQTIEYANARIRGHRTKLFKLDALESLLKHESFESFLVALGGTKYKRALEQNLTLYKGATAVGKASSDYILSEFRFVDSLLDEKQGLSIRALGAYWDFNDFKLVMRGVHAGAARDDLIKAFVGPGVAISRENLTVLANQENLEDLVSLALVMGVPYFKGMPELNESHYIPEAFAELEAQLDKAFFNNVMEALKKGSENELIRRYFIGQINKRNLMMLARLIRADISFSDAQDAERYFLAGGTLISEVEQYFELSKLTGLDQLARALRDSREGKIMKAELGEYYLSDSLSSLDRALDTSILSELIGIGKRDLFGNGIALAYLLSLYNEIRNIRLVAHGKSFHIDAADIKKEFIVI